MLSPKRIASALLAALMLLPAVVFPAAAADDAGMSFTAGKLLTIAKDLDKAPLTYEAVIRLPKGYTDRAGLILSNYAGNSNIGIALQFNSAKNLELYYELNTAASTSVRHKFDKIPVSAVATGEWVHIAVVKDDAEGKAHAYINGEFVQTSGVSTQPYGYFTSGANPPAICIGGDHRSGNSQYFKGEIREIALYSDVRTAEEIKADYAGIKKENDNLLMWHKLSAGITSSTDLSGNGYDTGTHLPAVDWLKNKKPVTDYAYSFAVVGDTQYIARDNPENMTKYYQWILDNKDSKKIECVIGLGDITDGNKTSQWEAAKKSISMLDGKVFYTLVRGNHDNASSLNTHLGTEAYYNQLKSRGDAGVMEEGKLENAYTTFTVGKTDYLILMLDFGAKDEVLAWASSILEKYPKHRAIITTHAYMYFDGTTLSPEDKWIPTNYDPSFNNGSDMWTECFSKYENVFLVLSGHVLTTDIVYRQEKGVNGNRVTQMLIDPQSLDNKYKDLGSLGLIAMFYFNEDGTEVSVEYYSILHDEYFSKASQFDMVLFEKEKPVETTAAPETTAAAPETTTAAPETTTVTGSAPLSDAEAEANHAVWILVAAVAVIAAAAVIVIKRKK